jgi:salicylate hydroxylase
MPVPDVAFVHCRTGALLAGSFDLGRPVDRGLESARHIHRADLHAILFEAVRAIDPRSVLTGKNLHRVDDSTSAGPVMHFADGSSAACELLVAADGARSTVRRELFDDGPPQFAGQVAFRCLVPSALAAPFMGAGNAVVSIGPGRIFHRYLLRGGALVNVVGIARSDRWRREGWRAPASVAEFVAEYAGFHDDVLGLIRCAPEQSLIKWALFVRPPLRRWHRGRVVLLGDAGHPVLPFLGLGAALAIEDGIVLARALAALADVEEVFVAYQRARLDRVEAVRVQSIRQGETIQAGDPDRDELTRAPAQDARLFDYDPCSAVIGAGTVS